MRREPRLSFYIPEDLKKSIDVPKCPEWKTPGEILERKYDVCKALKYIDPYLDVRIHQIQATESKDDRVTLRCCVLSISVRFTVSELVLDRPMFDFGTKGDFPKDPKSFDDLPTFIG